MATVDPSSWTGMSGGRNRAFDFLFGNSEPNVEPRAMDLIAAETALMERPADPAPKPKVSLKARLKDPTPRPSPVPDNFLTTEGLDEYAEIAALVGVEPPALAVERFKTYLRATELTVYSLAETVAYMDDKAKTEGQFEWGWEWRPLRAKDAINASFGRRATRGDDEGMTWARAINNGIGQWDGSLSQARALQNQFTRRPNTPASDWYSNGQGRGVYNLTVPLHALKKVAKIEKEYPGDKAFFVSDYALAPAIQHPDPFLMVVVPNADVHRGNGRFVIDFWEEPNFGIEQMLKSDL